MTPSMVGSNWLPFNLSFSGIFWSNSSNFFASRDDSSRTRPVNGSLAVYYV